MKIEPFNHASTLEFIMELHHKSFEGDEANMKALLHGLTHLCELMSDWLHKRN